MASTESCHPYSICQGGKRHRSSVFWFWFWFWFFFPICRLVPHIAQGSCPRHRVSGRTGHATRRCLIQPSWDRSERFHGGPPLRFLNRSCLFEIIMTDYHFVIQIPVNSKGALDGLSLAPLQTAHKTQFVITTTAPPLWKNVQALARVVAKACCSKTVARSTRCSAGCVSH